MSSSQLAVDSSSNTVPLNSSLQRTSSSPSKRIESSLRRVRVLYNKKFIADTTSAKLVWERPYYPNYFLPSSDVQTKYLEKIQKTEDGDGYICTLKVGDRSTDKVLWFEEGELKGLIRFEFSEMGIYLNSITGLSSRFLV
jgi:uncharacterized protein (DUF427 family)